MIQRPGSTEYESYYHTYVSKVPEGDVLAILAEGQRETASLLSGASPEKASSAYAEGKWTLKEVVGHLIDTERVFSFRAFSFARKDPAELPSMDQEAYAAVSHWGLRSVGSILSEMEALRRSTLSLFRSFTEEEWVRSGTASGCSFTVRSFPYIIAGHEIHHKGVIREKYLG